MIDSTDPAILSNLSAKSDNSLESELMSEQTLKTLAQTRALNMIFDRHQQNQTQHTTETYLGSTKSAILSVLGLICILSGILVFHGIALLIFSNLTDSKERKVFAAKQKAQKAAEAEAHLASTEANRLQSLQDYPEVAYGQPPTQTYNAVMTQLPASATPLPRDADTDLEPSESVEVSKVIKVEEESDAYPVLATEYTGEDTIELIKATLQIQVTAAVSQALRETAINDYPQHQTAPAFQL